MPALRGSTPLDRMLIAAGVRRTDVAAAAGCTLETVAKVANGEGAALRCRTLLRVSAALGLAPAELVPSLAVRPAGGLLSGIVGKAPRKELF